MFTAERPGRIGWIVDSAPRRVFSFPWQALGPVSQIRYGNLARQIQREDPRFRMERYWPMRRYDAVVIIKKLNPPTLEAARRLKAGGTKIIFDSNVNYYERWGTYDIPGTEPRPDQTALAEEMTRLADLVVADSTYLAVLCRKINPQVVTIPDAVDTLLYRPGVDQKPSTGPLKVIWSGISKKAHHLQLIEEVLGRLRDKITLQLVINRPHPADPPSPVIARLQTVGNCHVTYFDYKRYAMDLQASDVIISPKLLSSAYEMSHTEYKITLGMSVGLPALASPQPSYREALEGTTAGWICETPEQWQERLEQLAGNHTLVAQMGKEARKRVQERYSVEVLAEKYKAALLSVMEER